MAPAAVGKGGGQCHSEADGTKPGGTRKTCGRKTCGRVDASPCDTLPRLCIACACIPPQAIGSAERARNGTYLTSVTSLAAARVLADASADAEDAQRQAEQQGAAGRQEASVSVERARQGTGMRERGGAQGTDSPPPQTLCPW